jgi:hypothetical protein
MTNAGAAREREAEAARCRLPVATVDEAVEATRNERGAGLRAAREGDVSAVLRAEAEGDRGYPAPA